MFDGTGEQLPRSDRRPLTPRRRRPGRTFSDRRSEQVRNNVADSVLVDRDVVAAAQSAIEHLWDRDDVVRWIVPVEIGPRSRRTRRCTPRRSSDSDEVAGYDTVVDPGTDGGSCPLVRTRRPPKSGHLR